MQRIGKYRLYVEYFFISSSGVIQGMTGTGTMSFCTMAMLEHKLNQLVYCPINRYHLVMHYEITELLDIQNFWT